MASHPFQNFMIRYRAGEAVFQEGEAASTMFIVHAGRIDLYRSVKERRQSLGVMEKGDFFGEMSILEGLPRTHSAEAVEDAELIEINSMIFDKMMRSNIEIGIRMLRKLSIRLRETEKRLTELQVSGARPVAPAATRGAAGGASDEAAQDGARFVADESGAVLPLADGETILGRYDPVTHQRPDVDLTELDLKRSVSRRHARVLRTGAGHVVIVEVGALHGTRLNGEPIDPGVPFPLADGDRLTLGNVGLVFRV